MLMTFLKRHQPSNSYLGLEKPLTKITLALKSLEFSLKEFLSTAIIDIQIELIDFEIGKIVFEILVITAST